MVLVLILFIFPSAWYYKNMSIEIWGTMPKAQDDPTTIDEAIATAIASHEADASSHVADTKSIGLHRTNGVIDHPAFSVVGDKFSSGLLNSDWFQTDFSTYQRWQDSGGGTITGEFQGQMMDASGASNTYKLIQLYDLTGTWMDSDNYGLEFELITSIHSLTSHEIWFGINVDHNAFDTSSSPSNGFGFKVLGTTLYAVWADDDGTVHTVSLGAIDDGVFHKFSCVFVSGTSLTWLIDDVQVHQILTSIPDFYPTYIFGISIDKHTGSSGPQLVLSSLVVHRVPH